MKATDDAPASGPAIHWNDTLLLGYRPMDDMHEEFVGLVAALQRAEPVQIEGLLDALQDHMRRHFGEEDAWMQQTGFPPRQCHMDEHAEVMGALERVRQQAEMGIYAFCRPFADYLAQWFERHAAHLDSALAHWMCKDRLGGKPVVLRRSLGATGNAES